MRVAPPSTATVQDHVALAEIELCGELMIAASAADGEWLSPDRIDEVLKVVAERAALSRESRQERGETSPG
ncbi:hypothetical protein SLUN_18540 [Streptomyces lunaelactis]|uniref:Uncharacterized protein n=1 Tax=Streptomyces lunaelactis TaxID=1535768 RepID=A0A2R4T410_9ACTN|nr:hypothetical protein [Streptomyces lunaelactis]AVZ73879.1 hypothetical protein SLUN_18540 [Streptomyces lunaelactis]NUK04038.1 hypothetical protein [Streptomyces lunaelactis]NUK11895.1 hypothetical protein [Streptomyces lunaelactis]NUK19383.1 hypothetical protein [Streptomyces lunaelactis]NUK25940.1 hypothetical protein [Streptomyces lunaelactis]